MVQLPVHQRPSACARKPAARHGNVGRIPAGLPLVWFGLTVAVLLAVSSAKASPQVPMQPAAPQPPNAESKLDYPLRLLSEAQQTYKQVRDYSCTLITQEQIKGKLLPEHVIDLRIRVQPFSVAMRFLAPKEAVGREVYYVHGQNKNKMRVRESGVAGALGFISIDPNDPRVREHSRHTITEMGIGHLIQQLTNRFEQERRINKTDVRTAEYEYNNRRCIRVEAIRLERNAAYYCYRTVVYFDKENRLPIRIENYDWPRAGGSPSGDLLECFSYINVQFNRGLKDTMFNP